MADNYDSAIDETFGPSPAAKSADPYDAAIDEVVADQGSSVQQSMYAAKDVSPDRAAEAYRLSKKTKLPVSVVDGDYDRIKREENLRSIDYQELSKKHPHLSQWLGDINNSKLAQDDIPALQKVEDAFRDHSNQSDLAKWIDMGLTQIQSSIVKMPALASDSAVSLVNAFLRSTGHIDKEDVGFETPIPLAHNSATESLEERKKQILARSPELNADVLKEAGAGNYSVAGKALVAQLISNAPNQAILIALAMRGMGTQGLAFAGASSAAEAASENREAGVSTGIGTADALIKGGIEAQFEKLGTFNLLKKWEGAIAKNYGKQVSREVVKDFAKTLAASAIGEGNEEAMTSLAQDFTDMVTDVNPNAMEGSLMRALNAGLLGFTSGVALTTPGGIASGIEREAQARSAERARKFYLSLGPTLEASKLRERLPEAQRKLVEQITKETEVENIYIPIDAIDTYFQGENSDSGELINPVAVMQQLGVLEQYNEAKETGTDVKIPLGTWVEQIVGTEHYNALADDIKFSPQDLTINEAKAVKEQVDAQMKEEAEKAKASEKEVTAEDSAAVVGETVAQQLEAAGVDPEQSVIYESAFKTLGERLGVDPQELFKQFNLKVSGAQLEDQSGQVLNQEDEVKKQRIQKALQETFESPDAIERYSKLPDTEGGLFVDTDTARTLYEPYAKDREGAIVHLDDTDSPAGKLAAKVWESRLAQPSTNYAQILAGGSASGKTRYRTKFKEAISEADVIFDTTSANYERTKERIEQALASGRKVLMTYIYRDFEDALAGNAARFKETGRIVSPDYMAYSHVESLNSFLKLADEYKQNPDVTFEAFDNSHEEPQEITLAVLAKKRYNDSPGGSIDEADQSRTEETRAGGEHQSGAGENAQSDRGSQETAVARLTRLASERLKNETEEIRATKERALSAPEDLVLNQSAVPSPKLNPLGFFSQLEAEVQKMDFKSIPAKDLASRIQNIQGLKKEELDFTGFLDWLRTREGKVTKEQVVEFLSKNGLQIEQVVLSEKFESTSDIPGAADLDWSEPERDHHSDSDNINSEYDYFRYEVEGDYWAEEKKSFESERRAEFVDEDGNFDQEAFDEAWESELNDLAEKRAQEYVESDDYGSAIFTVEESTTGWTLSGSDDFGWWSSETGKHYNDELSEVKVKLVREMIRRGDIEGDIADTIRAEDIEWRKPTAAIAKPKSVISRKANEIIRRERNRLEIKARDENSWNYTPEESIEDQAKNLEIDVKDVARQEAKEFFSDPTNPKNVVKISINHPALDGSIEGNNHKGFEFTVYGPEQKSKKGTVYPIRLQQKLLATTPDAAKFEAIQLLQEKGLIAKPKAEQTSEDVNKPVGRSKFNRYVEKGGENYREILITAPELPGSFKHGGHFDQKNVLVHLRLTDRTDGEGRKTLVADEIQSDWHQQGRERGYIDPKDKSRYQAIAKELDEIDSAIESVSVDLPEAEFKAQLDDLKARQLPLINEQKELDTKLEGVAEAPFKNTDAWASLAIKRLMRLAAEQNYDAIAWMPAKTHVERWGTDSVSWMKKPKQYRVTFRDPEIAAHSAKTGSKTESKRFTKEELDEFMSQGERKKSLEVHEEPAHWLVGSVEQVGGNADGTNIEELARMRGELLEKKGERVTTKEELRNVLADTLNRERNDRSLDSLTENVWGQMQTKESGVKAPRKEGMEFFYDKVIPDVTKKLIKKFGGKIDVTEFNINGEEDVQALEVVLSPEMKEKILGEGFALFQPGDDQGPRGQIQIGAGGINISILKTADASTFFHETGHFYLEVLSTLAAKENTPQQIKDDFQIVREWVGAEEGAKFTTEQHELFARGFEAYLMEGRAPSDKLRKAFARFKVWLISVYKQIKSLNVELTDDVRGVMDRLLATDEEIQKAHNKQGMEPLFKDPAAIGLTGEKHERYLRAREEAKEMAEEQITQKVMADYQRQKEVWWDKEWSKVRAEFEPQVHSQKIYRALSILQKGKLPDGSPLPDGMPELKISKKLLVQAMGKDILKKLPRPYIYSAKEGLHPDVVAELLGFTNGAELIDQIIKTPKMDQALDEMADSKMKELHPDILSSGAMPEEAIKAVHNEKRTQLLRMELEHLASNDLPVLKDVIRKITKRVPTEKMVREQATRIIAQRKVGDLQPYQFQRAEARAAREAGEKLAQGDFDGAFDSKLKELLNHELYRAAVSAQEDVEASLEAFKKISKADEKLAKSRDMDFINAARAILSNYGLDRFEDSPEVYLEPIRRYDPESYQVVEQLVSSTMATAGPYKTVSFDAFVGMTDTVMGLWDLSRSTRQMEVDGLQMERSDVIEELKTTILNLDTADRRAGYERAVGTKDKVVLGLLGTRAALRRVESWVDAMDEGNLNGPFRRYIWNPISEATTKYRGAKRTVVEKYLDLATKISPTLTTADIPASELSWIDRSGQVRFYTFSGKQELLGALLHTGNESNLSKLLRGRKWGDIDANDQLDTSQWDMFIRRMIQEGVLTKADYDFVQGVWDLLEEMKPEAQKAHKAMYGHYFSEITANEFQTPFGVYRGGYVPAIADPYIADDAAIREEKAIVENLNNSFMFPTAGRGFTKSRVDAYARPLTLDLRFIPGHIDKVLRFVHIEPHVKEVGRLVMDRSFRGALDHFDPAAGGDMLVPWLQRAAMQKIETPSQGKAGRAADVFFKQLRTRTGFNIMTANVLNTLQQFTGISITALKVKPRFLRDALWNYTKAPTKTTEDVIEASEFMRNKLTQSAAEIQGEIDEMLLNPTKYENAKAFAMKHGYFLQGAAQNVVDVIAWSGAYDQSVANGMNELEAVRAADSAVRLTQGSFAAEDVSRFETGSPFMRAFTMFYSYFNMLSNLLGSEVSKVAREFGLKKGAGKLLYIYTFGFMIPAMLSELIVRAGSGSLDEDDDDEYMDDLIGMFFGSQFRTATAMVPLVGPTVLAGVNSFNDKWYDDRISTSPAVAMIESAVSAPHSVYESIAGDGSKKKAIRDTLSLLGLMSGFPVAPLARPLGYLSDVQEGEVTPSGPIDFARGLVTGKAGAQ